jgi:exosortase
VRTPGERSARPTGRSPRMPTKSDVLPTRAAALSGQRYSAAVLAAIVVAVSYTYSNVALALIAQWADDQNYSHGFLIPPLAALFAWKRRAALAALRPEPTSWGLVVVAGSLVLLAAGVAAAELFVARASFVGLVAGSILFLYGRAHLRVLAFPIGFLLLMIPPPEIIFSQIALPLQLFASRVGELALRTSGVPVLRDGNVLELVGMRLEVAEACSGIRSIVALLAFALVIGELACSTAHRWMLAASTIPIAIVANAGRVAVTGLAAHQWGPAAAEGLLHATSGMVVFGLAVGALVLVDRAMSPRRARAVEECAT